MRKFEIPLNFSSSIIDRVKSIRSSADPRKQDFSPSILQFDNLKLLLPRHFGFCFGVQNAVEKSYQILRNHPEKNIYLISEMIHNPFVNSDLSSQGLRFIQSTEGKQLIDWNEIQENDIVIVPAFGTSLEILEILKRKKIQIEAYDTTCPFVERVWKKGSELSLENYTVIIHGTFEHEETRATFSRMSKLGKVVVIQNLEEAKILVSQIQKQNFSTWKEHFENHSSVGLEPMTDLKKLAVINQTTMLASETVEISNLIQSVIDDQNGSGHLDYHFANIRDTLCYATNDNQISNAELMNTSLDLALVVGGYNSSNTTHLAEMHSEMHPTFFIDSDDKIQQNQIRHYDIKKKREVEQNIHLKEFKTIAIVGGASCPDSIIEDLIRKVLSFQSQNADIEAALSLLEENYNGL